MEKNFTKNQEVYGRTGIDNDLMTDSKKVIHEALLPKYL